MAEGRAEERCWLTLVSLFSCKFLNDFNVQLGLRCEDLYLTWQIPLRKPPVGMSSVKRQHLTHKEKENKMWLENDLVRITQPDLKSTWGGALVFSRAGVCVETFPVLGGCDLTVSVRCWIVYQCLNFLWWLNMRGKKFSCCNCILFLNSVFFACLAVSR